MVEADTLAHEKDIYIKKKIQIELLIRADSEIREYWC